jgi:hypothetical protein
LRPTPNLNAYPFSPGDRGPISVAIQFDLSRIKGAMMHKANVSHGKANMDKGESYPAFIVYGLCIKSELSVVLCNVDGK